MALIGNASDNDGAERDAKQNREIGDQSQGHPLQPYHYLPPFFGMKPTWRKAVAEPCRQPGSEFCMTPSKEHDDKKQYGLSGETHRDQSGKQ